MGTKKLETQIVKVIPNMLLILNTIMSKITAMQN